jgi:HEAT repeat protein
MMKMLLIVLTLINALTVRGESLLAPPSRPSEGRIAELAKIALGTENKLDGKEWAVRVEAIRELSEGLGKDSVPYLVPLLFDQDLMIFWEAEKAIKQNGGIGPESVGAVPSLIPLLHGENWAKRLKAAEFLAKIGPGARAAIPALIKELDDPGIYAPDNFVRALSSMGPESVAALLPILKDVEGSTYRRDALGRAVEITCRILEDVRSKRKQNPEAEALYQLLLALLREPFEKLAESKNGEIRAFLYLGNAESYFGKTEGK